MVLDNRIGSGSPPEVSPDWLVKVDQVQNDSLGELVFDYLGYGRLTAAWTPTNSDYVRPLWFKLFGVSKWGVKAFAVGLLGVWDYLGIELFDSIRSLLSVLGFLFLL